MKEEIRKVLEMLEKGQVNSSQAAELLEAMDAFGSKQDSPAAAPKKRMLRIKAISADGKKVNVKVPASLIGSGINIGRYFNEQNMRHNEAVNDLDWSKLSDAVNQMLADDEAGEIVKVTTEDGDHVEISLE